MYRVAVIGAGIISGSHLAALATMEQCQAAAVADLDPGKAQVMAETYGIPAYTDYKQMIQEVKPDIAVITLPHFLHLEAAVYCAQQGCHLLLEKPMALNTQQCDEIIAAASKHNVRLMVAHTQHYLPVNLQAKKLLARHNLGELVMIQEVRHKYYFNAERPQWFLEKDKSGGGIIMNLGSHSVDKIQWLTGAAVTKVKAGLSFHGGRGDVEGSGLIYMETSLGVPVTICQSGYPGAAREETEFIFTGGMIKLQTGKGLWISENDRYREVEVEAYDAPQVLQFKELIAAIDEQREPECGGVYAREIINVIESIYKSHELGSEVAVTEQ
ncbi:Gfo/Idh/MocA family protein [Paenibacillus sp. GCM10027626]|uniref:Gfo/Idh/MocA family protein n=1 Tax=Paenibacillus sp. GCM10027626 TaxID=3273411 RepID=UPI0036300A35